MLFFFFFFGNDGVLQEASTDKVPFDMTPDEFEFFNDKIRYAWSREEQEWYFSIVDVISALTGSADGRKYWNKLKQRLKDEGNELVTNCHQLKLRAADGKMRKTDVASTEQLLRIIQSIPSPNAEPFKLWLAKVGKERLDETADPQLAIERAVETYRRQGYSEKWIKERMGSIKARNELTAEWHRAGVEAGSDFAMLTNVLTKAWSGMTVGQYKTFKGLHKESLRDNMTTTELAFNSLAEVSATELSRAKDPSGIDESRDIATHAGRIAGNARRELEEAIGRSVISSSSASDKKLLDE